MVVKFDLFLWSKSS